MPPSNIPEGFLGFQAQIEALTEALGGTDGVRVVIEDQFNRCLRDTIMVRLYGTIYGGPSGRYSGIWTAATNSDFEAGANNALSYFRARPEDLVRKWDSAPLGVKIVQRDMSIYLEGGDHAMFLVTAWADTHAAARIHPAQTTRRDPWHIAIMDGGKTILDNLKRSPSKAAVEAQGRGGATNSLIRFAELFV